MVTLTGIRVKVAVIVPGPPMFATALWDWVPNVMALLSLVQLEKA